jgi:hypothetical protein
VAIAHGGSKQPPYAGLLSSTLAYVEKVRSQFLSLRQLTAAVYSLRELVGKYAQ